VSTHPRDVDGSPVAVERRLLRLMWPFRLWILGGAALGSLAIGSSVGLMAVSAYLISQSALISNVAEVALAVTAVRVLAISRAAFRYLERYVSHRATLRILANLRAWFYEAIEPLAPARLESHRAGDLLTRIVRDVDTLEDFYVRVLLPPLVAVAVTAFASLALGSFSPALGVVVLAFLLLAGVVLPLVSRSITREPSLEVVAARARLDAALVDGISGMADLVVFDQGGRQRAAQLALGRSLDVAQERIALLRGVSAGLGALAATLAGVTLLGVAIPLVTDGQLDGVFLALIPLAAIASFEAVQTLSPALQQLDSSRAAARRLFALIDAEPEVLDPPDPAPLPASRGISIEGLRFRYGPEEPMVFDGLDLEIPAGSSLGLVGPSGVGKSTIVNLLLRFREYSEGRILLGGTDLRALAADDVRATIGVVSQRVDLFDATIRDNLAVAHAEVTDERIVEACRMADLHTVIEALPDGYDTRIGEQGIRLSGGERQRLAIARAVIKDAPILILDEATANLDEATEDRVLQGLGEFMAERTTLIISHRRSVAERAERVVGLI
jgi:thiol reductant ABC exporter CydC subunit